MEKFQPLIDALNTINISSVPPQDGNFVNTNKLVALLYRQEFKKAYTTGDVVRLLESLTRRIDFDYLMTLSTVLGLSLAYNVYLQEQLTALESPHTSYCKMCHLNSVKLGNDKETIAARLRASREAMGFASAREFAVAHRLNTNMYEYHENAERKPQPKTLALYSKIFNLSPEWLALGRGNSGVTL